MFRHFLGRWGIDSSAIDRVVYIYIAYGPNNGGFMGETIRSAVLAVPMGQTEAGYATGLTGWQTLVHIVAPQAARISLPMMGTTFIYAFQATALAYMVGVIDMIGKTRSLGSVTGAHPGRLHYLRTGICSLKPDPGIPVQPDQ